MGRSSHILSRLGDKPAAERSADKAELQARIRSGGDAILVVNTRARRGERLYSEAKDLLLSRGIRLTGTYPVRDPVRLPEIVAEAISQRASLVIVGGGDGTISSVVDFFAHRDVALGVLPLGTANSFVRSLGIPLDLAGAVDVIASGKIADVDLGCIGEDFFANAAALGISPAIGRKQPHFVKRHFGRAGYLIAAARALASYRPFRCRLVQDNGEVTTIDNALDILIANGTHHGGLRVADEADLESRDLVIRIIKGSTRFALLRAWLRIWTAQPLPDLELIRTTGVTLETEPSEYVSIDGEVVTKTPIRISVARQALHLFVPNSFRDK